MRYQTNCDHCNKPLPRDEDLPGYVTISPTHTSVPAKRAGLAMFCTRVCLMKFVAKEMDAELYTMEANPDE